MFFQGTWGYQRVLKAFPGNKDILQPDGELDREAIAAIVFSDSAARRRLNAATHLPVLFGIIRQTLFHWLRFQPIAVIDMPLLFETGFYRITRPNLVVQCAPDVQLQRLQERDSMEKEAAEARIAAQMPMEGKIRLAGIVVDNNGTIEELREKAAAVVERLQRGAWIHKILFSPAGLVLATALIWRFYF